MGGGDDAVMATRGRDEVDGGKGAADAYSGVELNRALTVDLQRGFAKKKGAGRDALENVEVVAGSGRNDRIKGDDGDDARDGRGGGDRLWGREGGDPLFGSDGDDRLWGGAGDDAMWGGDGGGEQYGGAGDDTMYGSGSQSPDMDELYGGTGDDTMFGGGGDDVLEGGPGTDVLYGGDGSDLFILDASPAEGGPDRLVGFVGAEGDRLSLVGLPSEYEAVIVDESTEIRRNGQTVAVLEFEQDADVLQDALFQ